MSHAKIKSWSPFRASDVDFARLVVEDEWPKQQHFYPTPFFRRFRLDNGFFRFGSALNLNIHFHILFLDGVYTGEEHPKFHRLHSPSNEEVQDVVQRIHKRIVRHLKSKGYLRDDETEFGENADPLAENNPLLAACVAASVQNKVAFGERAGQWVRKFLVHSQDLRANAPQCAQTKGFSLHAGVSVEAKARKELAGDKSEGHDLGNDFGNVLLY